jgi:hypothetical protein
MSWIAARARQLRPETAEADGADADDSWRDRVSVPIVATIMITPRLAILIRPRAGDLHRFQEFPGVQLL